MSEQTESTHTRSYWQIKKQAPVVMNFPVHLGNVVEFPEGIPGFEEVRCYQFRSEERFRPFLFMDAVGDYDLSFVCVDTFFVYPGYEVNLSPELTDALELDHLEDAAVFSIVNVANTVEDTTANLLSPLILNLKIMRGYQVLLEDSGYPVRYRIWEALQEPQDSTEPTDVSDAAG